MDINDSGQGSDIKYFGVDGCFNFDCRSDLPCFGQCCRDINIFLTPYDVLRLKKRLGLSSSSFLNIYTNEIGPPQILLPVMYLRMNEGDGLKCPFVTVNGCTIYEERPWSCRMAPVDMSGPGKYKFAFDRSKCLGLNEKREWTVREWMAAQDMDIYEAVEDSFKQIPMLVKFTGEDYLDRAITRLFRIVFYDTDAFKEIIAKNRFLIKEAGLERESFERSLKDDFQVLKSGLHWFINVTGDKNKLKKVEKIIRSF